MTIQEVYLRYQIPPNLQMHMLRVASIGEIIADNWKEKNQIDKNVIITALLLHDMGNIIKFDFSRAHLLGEEEGNIEYWKNIQQQFKSKYQNDEHIATHEIAKELGVVGYKADVLNATGSSKLQENRTIKDWNKKIVCYSDFRVDPFGIVTINARFDDLVVRYKNRYSDIADNVEKRRVYCQDIENQLQENLDIDLQSLNNEGVKERMESLKKFEI